MMVGIMCQPTSTLTARQAAMRRTPDARRRVMKNSTEPAYWVSGPKRWRRNS